MKLASPILVVVLPYIGDNIAYHMGYTSVMKCIHIEIRTKFNLIHEKE